MSDGVVLYSLPIRTVTDADRLEQWPGKLIYRRSPSRHQRDYAIAQCKCGWFCWLDEHCKAELLRHMICHGAGAYEIKEGPDSEFTKETQ